ncbi:sulfite reductase flavoprotein subunit alpha [Roseomonas hellenica]|uniref:NADPH--hemoprotein reductase n=1 Tax=Plastoroseomonas hellenica TaxID=2687306 RepID=A0ABS5F2E1_9PROT|nr:sulfite reductase flavoprotein subunit alpha [Plastoroseomonas hellenica]MBR0666712.1 sulfite reductase flavoprotein subunit alpha [Plastoroseomonas hellenica]
MPDTDRMLAALTVLLAWLAFSAVIAWRAWRRAQAQRRAAEGTGGPAEYLVVHASQTGFAEQLAARTAEALRSGGLAVRAARIDALTGSHLGNGNRVLFLASTAGEGDAPDDAAVFIRKVMANAADLSSLRYGLLALGDSSYANYCAFGRRLDAWLRERGATPLFPVVEVDDGDAAALRQWEAHLGHLAGRALAPAWRPPRHEAWRLAERRLLNPGSPGAPAFHIALTPPAALPDWQAGDIAEVMPRNAPHAVRAMLAVLDLDPALPVHAEDGTTLAEVLAARRLPEDVADVAGLPAQALVEALPKLPHRDYSIASLPADGTLQLLVREMRHPDGRLGLGSGWLTAHAAAGGTVDLRIRRNAGFHPPPDGRPMILIGNGTGLAGLRAHLKAREAAGHRRNWLIFGERTRAADYFHRDEVEAWVASGLLDRLDLAFSRDQAGRVYVQHLLASAGDTVRGWVGDGAAVYVCGSQAGMATAVHAALAAILDEDGLAALLEAGRYRRDVY